MRLFGFGVLDLLRLVEDHAGPRDLLQGVDVALQQAVAGDHHRLLPCLFYERNAALSLNAVMDQHRKLRGEPSRLPLPVVHHRGRADQEDRAPLPSLPVALDHRQGHDGLAKAHIVGQTRAQPPLAQKMEPRIAAHLIRPKRPGKGIRRGEFIERRSSVQLFEKVSDPTGRLDPAEIESARSIPRPERHLHDIPNRRLARGLLLPEVDRRLNLCRVQLHPLAAEPDQRRLHPGQHLQLAAGELPVAEGQIPVEPDYVGQR